jgi:hypothetical protein
LSLGLSIILLPQWLLPRLWHFRLARQGLFSTPTLQHRSSLLIGAIRRARPGENRADLRLRMVVDAAQAAERFPIRLPGKIERITDQRNSTKQRSTPNIGEHSREHDTRGIRAVRGRAASWRFHHSQDDPKALATKAAMALEGWFPILASVPEQYGTEHRRLAWAPLAAVGLARRR